MINTGDAEFDQAMNAIGSVMDDVIASPVLKQLQLPTITSNLTVALINKGVEPDAAVLQAAQLAKKILELSKQV
jgi:hypothetical protein